MTEKIIMTSEDVRRSLARIAHEIIERNKTTEDMVLIGLRTRGVPLAKRLAANMEKFEGLVIPVGALDIGPYRDDLASHSFPCLNSQPTQIPVNVEGLPERLGASASFVLRQSDFGITPYSALGGLLAVQDAIVIEFKLLGR